MRKVRVLYPYLFVVLIVLVAVLPQSYHVPLEQVGRPMAYMLGGTVVLMGLLRLAMRDAHRAGVVCLYLLATGALFGRILRVVTPYLAPLTAHAAPVTAAGLLALLIGGAYALWKTRCRVEAATPVLNAMVGAMLAMSALMMAIEEYKLSKPWEDPSILVGAEPIASLAEQPAKPDIYYIILDGHARADVLREVYDYNNEEFVQFLEDRGFYVAEESTANYGQTALSLASSLNMTYLAALPASVGVNSSDRTPLLRLIQESHIRHLLEDAGYSTVAFETGYKMTELHNADHYLRSGNPHLTTLERVLISESVLGGMGRFLPRFDAWFIDASHRGHRARVEYILDQLPAVAQVDGPKFVFAHIVSPHPPFVFDANGRPVLPDTPFSDGDGSSFVGTRSEYVEGYREQIAFINAQMMEVVSAILENSEEPPIIIIQADHGSGVGVEWESVEETDTWERMSILNAYYLPGCEDCLYDTITPANSFRVVLNEYLGASLPLLPDQGYMSTWEDPYRFVRAFPNK